MFILRSTATPPEWLTLTGSDARVLVKPLDATASLAADFAARRAVALLALNSATGTAAADNAQAEATFIVGRTRALADQIVEWEGFTDEAGAPLPITPEALDAFAAHAHAGPAFYAAYEDWQRSAGTRAAAAPPAAKRQPRRLALDKKAAAAVKAALREVGAAAEAEMAKLPSAPRRRRAAKR